MVMAITTTTLEVAFAGEHVDATTGMYITTRAGRTEDVCLSVCPVRTPANVIGHIRRRKTTSQEVKHASFMELYGDGASIETSPSP